LKRRWAIGRGAKLQGRIVASGGGPPTLSRAAVVRTRLDPVTDFNRYRTREASTDQNGHFMLKDIPPGKYKVSAKLPLGEREHRVLDIKLAVPKSE